MHLGQIVSLFVFIIVGLILWSIVLSHRHDKRERSQPSPDLGETAKVVTTDKWQVSKDQKKEKNMEFTNIMARYENGETSLKCRLVFDQSAGVIYWGKPIVYGADVPETSRLSVDIENIKDIKIVVNESLWSRKCYIHICDHNSDIFAFRIYELEGKNFVHAVRSYMEIRKEELLEEALLTRKNLINKYFKTSLVVKLQDFAQRHSKEISKVSMEKRDLNLEAAREILYSILEEEIIEGNLKGVLDRDNHEYRDRDFIVQQQKVIHINVAMDFNSIIKQLGNKGIALQSIQCPQCNGACPVPQSGNQFKCDYCGALISVTDVFEKFKGLLE